MLRVPSLIQFAARTLLGTWALCGWVQAADKVVLKASSGRGTTLAEGTILDFNARELVLQLSSGREQRYAAAEVVALETARTSDQQTGEKRLAEGKFAEAGLSLRAALRSEKRLWVQREIQAGRVVAACEAGDRQLAGEMFLALVRGDAHSRHWNVAPLAWLPEQPSPSLEAKARAYLTAGDTPAARLLGASWLLTTGQQREAAAELSRLATASEVTVAQLAAAQLWRVQWAAVTPADVDRWQFSLEKMPEPLRAGPYFPLGKALARLERHEEAALTFLKIPVLFPQPRRLAAEALLAAGQELDKLKRPHEALTVYRELATRYPQSPLVEAARQRLDAKED